MPPSRACRGTPICCGKCGTASTGLNARYPRGRFLLFHRRREWSETEQKWIGWERKRGKIEDLNAFLCGEGSPEILYEGSLPLPVRSVITLDSDTQLPPEPARRLVETIAHPLNRVVIDPATATPAAGIYHHSAACGDRTSWRHGDAVYPRIR